MVLASRRLGDGERVIGWKRKHDVALAALAAQLEGSQREAEELRQQLARQCAATAAAQRSASSEASRASRAERRAATAEAGAERAEQQAEQWRAKQHGAVSELQALRARMAALEEEVAEAQQRLVAAQRAAAADAAAQPGRITGPPVLGGPSASGSKPAVVVFVGGRRLRDTDRAMLPPDVEVLFFGSDRDVGSGELERLVQVIKGGRVDAVYSLSRWNGHNTTETARKACRTAGIPFYILGQPQRTRLKAEMRERAG